MNHQNEPIDASPGSVNTDNIVISARNVSKMYPLYANPRDRLRQSLWYARPRFLRGTPPQFYKEFWALRHISFEVKKGEVVGIIGRNGAGKSTLLQIIAGTLAPTGGEVRVKGQTAALLELGSGFNPEFTGRENVYLNGSILGLSRAEVDDMFDDIAAFADIGQFIDQPVKLYSSGMRMRLVFAVQTFVPKAVLIVDEALAVGDPAFQRKCWAALEKFVSNGGTVLLVTHSAQTIVRLCERCLLLANGELLVDGFSKPVTDIYQRIMFSDAQTTARILSNLRRHGLAYTLSQSDLAPEDKKVSKHPGKVPQTAAKNDQQITDKAPVDWFDPNMPQPDENSYGNGQAEIIDYAIYNEQGKRVNVLVMGRRYRGVCKVRFYRDSVHVRFGVVIKTVDGVRVASINNHLEQIDIDYISAASVVEASFSFKLNLAPGTYVLDMYVVALNPNEGRTFLHRRVDMCMIRVLPCDSRTVPWIAYLEPKFEYRFVQEKTEILSASERDFENGN